MQVHPLWSVFQYHLTRKADENSWKQCGSVVLELRGEQAKVIIPRAKPVPGIECSGAMHR